MAFTLEKPRTVSRAGGNPFEIWKTSGGGAMDEDLVVDVPMRLAAVYLDVTGGAAAENLVVDINDDADVIVCAIQTKGMGAVTAWPWLPNPAHFLPVGWRAKFTWANTASTKYVMRVILTEA